MQYINPELDIEQLGRSFQRDGRVLIRDFFDPAVVQALSAAVDQIDWALTYRDTKGDRVLSGEQLRALTPEQREMLVEGVNTVARNEFQFSFFTESMVAAAKRGDTDLLARFMRWMADEQFMATIRQITGITEINRVYAQATMYTRGNFLVAHDDHVDAEDRRLAYVINLTRKWRPDWGGLLHFTKADGSVTDSYFPHFNSLSLFKVPQSHFVSYVPPFANAERTAITGWLIAA
ncbi:2OG-Fe(II) oxygenase [Roseateles oligotrophus]|uniref:2OG-Fe(II) oxygenase n=1 Tax=Roseateles oligotrophus TaxID=1769250 RepID=A0ABT2YKX3_9BURK|nr:2OG-Fe(II) oxygenase family protein [Roseateles oligotrophus]MCV2370647.1 2OG-Fe(II) oxygenase [Roseateles oligotrophus]